MKIYDITQEVFSCKVFPGDPAPERTVLCDMEKGDLYNLSSFSMCAHNGTHVDAPYHFIRDAKRVEEIPLDTTVGWAYVAEFEGTLGKEDAEAIVRRAQMKNKDAALRILIKGKAVVSEEAAKAFLDSGVYLLGNESQTVGSEDAPMAVHKVLLSGEVVLLEGIRLANVEEGTYFLFAAPLLLGGADGAPVRAVLIDLN